MPEQLRALVVVLVLATVVLACARTPACAVASGPVDYTRRRNLWFAVTLVLFLAHNFWLFIFCVGAMLLFSQAREPNPVAMYFFLLFAAPAIPGSIPGLGFLNFLFAIHYIRLLALVVLLPASLRLRKQQGAAPFGRFLPDKLVACYLVLAPLLMVAHAPFTTTLRSGVFYPFCDVFLPYYVASRALRSTAAFRDALMAFLVAALVLAATLAFESARGWLLYHALNETLGQHWGYGEYLLRSGTLRASGTTGHAIAAGYVIAVALGFFPYLQRLGVGTTARNLALLLLAAGLVAPVSRGPWVGVAAIGAMLIATGSSPARGFANVALALVIGIPVLLTPFGDTIVDHLPFFGTVEASNVAARQRLAEVSTQVIMENPAFGRFDYIDHPSMQALRGSDGIIDLVNTYVIVGLSSGLVGLACFAGTFLVAGVGILQRMRRLPDRRSERHLLGQVLLATIVGILVMIATVNPIEIIKAVFWAVAGLGVSYAALPESEQTE